MIEESCIKKALQSAIKNQELYLNYQPIYNLITQKLIGMEALIRWQHSELGAISPDIFIPIAEKSNLILEIGQWVIEEACNQITAWLNQGHHHFKVFVNISPQQLLQKKFSDKVIQLVTEKKIPFYMLEFELTETSLMPYTETFKKALITMYESGISITIDDFGTGYSSLVHLKNLPIQAFKIDKTFMTDIDNDEKNAAIVNTLVQLGMQLGLVVIAEGIETEKQLHFLIENTCPLGQGHYLSPPLTCEEMTALLEKSLL